MTESFIEWIHNPTVIVRVGPTTSEHGRPFKRSVFGEVLAAGRVMLKGYDDTVDFSCFQEVMRKLWTAGFREATFERMGPPRRTIEIDLGPNGVAGMRVIYHDKQ